MASEETLQEKRQKAADLRNEIETEQKKRAVIVSIKESEQEEIRLDLEIARLNGELERERGITQVQAADAGVSLDDIKLEELGVTPVVPLPPVEAPAPVTPPQQRLTPPPAPTADSGDKKKEN